MNSDFKDLLRLLNTFKVRYLIVGGYAVIKYTEPRYTKDLDIWVEPTLKNARAVYAALAKFGAPIDNLCAEDFSVPGTLFMMGIPPARIDILTRIKGVRFASAWSNRVSVKLGKLALPFIGIKDLITAKRSAARLQDQIDLQRLLTKPAQAVLQASRKRSILIDRRHSKKRKR